MHRHARAPHPACTQRAGSPAPGHPGRTCSEPDAAGRCSFPGWTWPRPAAVLPTDRRSAEWWGRTCPTCRARSARTARCFGPPSRGTIPSAQTSMVPSSRTSTGIPPSRELPGQATIPTVHGANPDHRRPAVQAFYNQAARPSAYGAIDHADTHADTRASGIRRARRHAMIDDRLSEHRGECAWTACWSGHGRNLGRHCRGPNAHARVPGSSWCRCSPLLRCSCQQSRPRPRRSRPPPDASCQCRRGRGRPWSGSATSVIRSHSGGGCLDANSGRRARLTRPRPPGRSARSGPPWSARCRSPRSQRRGGRPGDGHDLRRDGNNANGPTLPAEIPSRSSTGATAMPPTSPAARGRGRPSGRQPPGRGHGRPGYRHRLRDDAGDNTVSVIRRRDL